jgi:hypothetical protein
VNPEEGKVCGWGRGESNAQLNPGYSPLFNTLKERSMCGLSDAHPDQAAFGLYNQGQEHIDFKTHAPIMMTTYQVENSGPWAVHRDVMRTKTIFGTPLLALQRHASLPTQELVQPFARMHPSLQMPLPAVHTSLREACCREGTMCAGELVDLGQHLCTDDFRPFASGLPAAWLCEACFCPYLRRDIGKHQCLIKYNNLTGQPICIIKH